MGANQAFGGADGAPRHTDAALAVFLDPASPWPAVLDLAGIGVALLSARGDYLRVNQVFAAHAGRRPDDLIARNHLELHAGARGFAECFARVLADGDPVAVRAGAGQGGATPMLGLGCWDWTLSRVAHKAGQLLVLTLIDARGRERAERSARAELEAIAGLLGRLPAMLYRDLGDPGRDVYLGPPGLVEGGAQDWAARVHPEDRERVAVARAGIRAGAERASLRYRIRQGDGEVREVQEFMRGQGHPDERAVEGLVVEVTGQDPAGAPPATARLVPETLRGLLITDRCGRIQEANSTYCRMSGRTRHELLQATLPELLAGRFRETARAQLEQAARDGHARFEAAHARARGEPFAAEFSITWRAVGEGGRFVWLVRERGAAGPAVPPDAGLLARLRRAIESRELELHYQPVLAAGDARIVGAEALLRWRDGEHGVRLPEAFLPLAESAGLLGRLDSWAIREACRQMVRWRARGTAPARVSVNLAGGSLVSDEVLGWVREALDESGLEPAALELELAEPALAGHRDQAIGALERLRGLGVRIAIDHFGTGPASPLELSRIPADRLDLDRSLVGTAATAQGEFLAALFAVADALHLPVLAEGVETQAQRRRMEQAGCRFLQGHLFGRPVPAAQFARWLG